MTNFAIWQRRFWFVHALGLGSTLAAYGEPSKPDPASTYHRCLLELSASGLKAAQKHKMIANLPDTIKMANMATYYYYYNRTYFLKDGDTEITGRDRTVTTALVPHKSLFSRTSYVNLAELSHDDPLPTRFLISDGSSQRSVIGIDMTPGSPLHRKIKEIAGVLRRRMNHRVTLTELASLLADNVAGFMGPVNGGGAAATNNGAAELPWDQLITSPFEPRLYYVYPDENPSYTNFELRVEPLESYIEYGEGYCIQQALLASLILRHFNYPHRLVNGSTIYSPGFSFGHTWIRLADDRILDPAARILANPEFLTLPQTAGPMKTLTEIIGPWYSVPGHKTWHNDQWHDTWRFEFSRYFVLNLNGEKL